MRYSIIIPMHNSVLTISDTLESVRAQSFDDYEVIVVDDRSNDRSWLLVESLQKEFPKLRLLKNSKTGANSARQEGVAACLGDFVLFLDSDDELTFNALNHFNSVIDYYSADLVCANMSLVTMDGQVLKDKIFDYPVSGFCTELYRGTAGSYQVPPSACAKLFRAEILKDIDFANVPFAQDWNISYKYLSHCSSIFFLEASTYSYVRRSGSTSSHLPSDGARILSACNSMLDIRRYWRSYGKSAEMTRFINHLSFRFFLNIYSRIFSISSVEERRRIFSDVNKLNQPLLVGSLLTNCVRYSPRELLKLTFYLIASKRFFLFSFLLGRLAAGPK